MITLNSDKLTVNSTNLSQKAYTDLILTQIATLGLNLGDKLNIFVSFRNTEGTKVFGQLIRHSKGCSFTEVDGSEFLDGIEYLSQLATDGFRIGFEFLFNGKTAPYWFSLVPWRRSSSGNLSIHIDAAGLGGLK